MKKILLILVFGTILTGCTGMRVGGPSAGVNIGTGGIGVGVSMLNFGFGTGIL